jgi:PadR family transcriptional regulator, regulatory protein AphA
VTTLTTTSYALLALLALRPWTAYELAQQMERSLRWIWPRAQSKVYEEPKKLVANGLARATKQKVGRRPRTVYAITPKGRRALEAWLVEPGAGISLEFEALLKVSFGDQGTRAGILTNLDVIITEAETRAQFGQLLADQYLSGGGAFPDRLAVSSLTWRFLWEHNAAVLRWAHWARQLVSSWPADMTEVDGAGQFRDVVANASPANLDRRAAGFHRPSFGPDNA